MAQLSSNTHLIGYTDILALLKRNFEVQDLNTNLAAQAPLKGRVKLTKILTYLAYTANGKKIVFYSATIHLAELHKKIRYENF